MSKILLIVAASLLVLTAGLSVLNKGKMSAKNDEIKQVKGMASVAQSENTRTKKALADNEKKLTDQTSKAADLQSQLTSSSGELAKAKDELTQATQNVAAKDAEIASLKANPSAPGLPQQPAGTDAAAQLQTALTEKAELQTVKEGLENKVNALQGQVTELERDRAQHVAGTMRPGLMGRVLAVDRNWNFVVLSLGDRNGVSNNSTMVVRRGENLVGRVRITSVEPSQSIADILPNSVPPGVSVQAGDTVMFPGGS